MKYAGPFLPHDQFRSLGLLHETNRLLLHPLGLALGVEVGPGAVQLTKHEVAQLAQVADELDAAANSPEDVVELADTVRAIVARAKVSTERLGSIWDQRADPEGVTYGEDLLSADYAGNVAREWAERDLTRVARLGYMVQPVEQSPRLDVELR